MGFRFNTGDLVVNMIAGESMTLGKVYPVVNSYDGHSGCGEQEWCRVPDDRGVVSGYDPDRFIRYTPGEQQGTLAAALRTRERLRALMKGVQPKGVFSELHGKLSDMLEDAESLVAGCAASPDANQVILNELKEHSRPGAHGVTYEVRVGSKVVKYVYADYARKPGGPLYYVLDGTTVSPVDNFDIMIAEVRYALTREAGGKSLSEWADARPPAVLGDFHPAHLEG